MVPTAMQFTLYACIFDRESYCHEIAVCGIEVCVILLNVRASIRSTRGLGPTMTVRGQSIGISIGMLP